MYLSILKTVNRYNTGTAVKSWFGGDLPEVVLLKEQQRKDIEDSFKGMRKRVSGGSVLKSSAIFRANRSSWVEILARSKISGRSFGPPNVVSTWKWRD